MIVLLYTLPIVYITTSPNAIPSILVHTSAVTVISLPVITSILFTISLATADGTITSRITTHAITATDYSFTSIIVPY